MFVLDSKVFFIFLIAPIFDRTVLFRGLPVANDSAFDHAASLQYRLGLIDVPHKAFLFGLMNDLVFYVFDLVNVDGFVISLVFGRGGTSGHEHDHC